MADTVNIGGFDPEDEPLYHEISELAETLLAQSQKATVVELRDGDYDITQGEITASDLAHQLPYAIDDAEEAARIYNVTVETEGNLALYGLAGLMLMVQAARDSIDPQPDVAENPIDEFIARSDTTGTWRELFLADDVAGALFKVVRSELWSGESRASDQTQIIEEVRPRLNIVLDIPRVAGQLALPAMQHTPPGMEIADRYFETFDPMRRQLELVSKLISGRYADDDELMELVATLHDAHVGKSTEDEVQPFLEQLIQAGIDRQGSLEMERGTGVNLPTREQLEDRVELLRRHLD